MCFTWHYYCCLVAKLCLFCDPMNGSPPGSSVHGISQARILGCVAFPSSGDPLNSGIKVTSALAGGFFPLSYLRNPQGAIKNF